MREILFRAKRIDNGEWVEGYYCKRKTYCFDKRTDELKTVIMTEFSSGGFVCYEVNSDTVCQYTGLTDKNGNKIWENDILFAKEPYIPTCPFSIRYNQETISYVGLYDGFGKEFGLSKELLSCTEVIGNIFDNPEMLGE